MNALQRAVSTVCRKVPRQLLAATFLRHNNPYLNTPNTLEYEILNQVIRPRVVADCDILGGIEDYIRLTGLPYERTPDQQSVVHIPKTRTNGRSITSALYLNYLDYTANTHNNAMMNFKPCSITPISAAAGAVAMAFSAGNTLGTSRLELIAENTLLIKEPVYSPQNAVLRCVLSNDENLNNLSIRTYTAFGELCTLAVKSHIYNEMIITIDEGVAQAGRSIGAYAELVRRYETAEEEYIAFLPRWKRILFMNDSETANRFIRAQINVMR